jgi:hypothetical protein
VAHRLAVATTSIAVTDTACRAGMSDR